MIENWQKENKSDIVIKKTHTHKIIINEEKKENKQLKWRDR